MPGLAMSPVLAASGTTRPALLRPPHLLPYFFPKIKFPISRVFSLPIPSEFHPSGESRHFRCRRTTAPCLRKFASIIQLDRLSPNQSVFPGNPQIGEELQILFANPMPKTASSSNFVRHIEKYMVIKANFATTSCAKGRADLTNHCGKNKGDLAYPAIPGATTHRSTARPCRLCRQKPLGWAVYNNNLRVVFVLKYFYLIKLSALLRFSPSKRGSDFA